MKTTNWALNIIPPTATFIDKYLDPADDKQLIIEYLDNDQLFKITPDRLDLDEFITYNHNNIYWVEGLTYNDVYEIYSVRFNLDLIKDEDYLDNPEVITETGRIYLPTNPLSTRYNSTTFIIDIIDKVLIFNGKEDERNLAGISLNPFSNMAGHALRFLNNHLIDGREITCFNAGFPTMEFRNLIIKTANITKDDLIKEIKSSFAISAFNDNVSDVVIMVGSNRIPYVVRYVSKENDIPVIV